MSTMSFDACLSVGGQSLLDAVGHLLQPALRAVPDPVPMQLPGATNASLRVRSLEFGYGPAGPAASNIALITAVDARAEVLLPLITSAFSVGVPLGDVMVGVPASTGDLAVPAADASITGIPGAVANPVVHIPAVDHGTLTVPERAIDVHLPANLQVPFPAIVPVAIELAPASDAIRATSFFDLEAVDPIDAGSHHGLVINLTPSGSRLEHLPTAALLQGRLNAARDELVHMLLGPAPLPAPLPPLDPGLGAAVLTALSDALEAALAELFSALVGRTGRLVFPAPVPLPDSTVPCDVGALPVFARTRTQVALDSTPLLLQIGFSREMPAAPLIWPNVSLTDDVDAQLDIGTAFLRDLLCCLVERLPKLTLPTPATAASGATPDCPAAVESCSWTGVILDLWPVTLTGSLSLCINTVPDSTTKSLTVHGNFSETSLSDLVRITADFTLTLDVELNAKSQLTALRPANLPGALQVNVTAAPGPLLVGLMAAAAGSFIVPLIPAAIPAVAVILGFIEAQITNILRALVSGSQQIASPPALPGGLTDAFGEFVPAGLTIDDFTAGGVLQTPITPWTLTPVHPPARRRPRQRKRQPSHQVPKREQTAKRSTHKK